MNRPVHFEIHASDPAALREFYSSMFGWSFEQWGDNDYWVAMTDAGSEGAPGINGGLLPRPEGKPGSAGPVNAFVITVDVPDCAQSVEKAVAMGASVHQPRQAMPGAGWLAYIKDPDGNLLGLMQEDPSAA